MLRDTLGTAQRTLCGSGDETQGSGTQSKCISELFLGPMYIVLLTSPFICIVISKIFIHLFVITIYLLFLDN